MPSLPKSFELNYERLITLTNQANQIVHAYRMGANTVTEQTFQDIYTNTSILPGQFGEIFMVRHDDVNDKIFIHTLTP